MKKLFPMMIFMFINSVLNADESHQKFSKALAHAPIGVMGDHLHKKGEWMFSYRYMQMDMQGNLRGDQRITPEQIVTSIPNRFFGQPMMPPTLRVVPINMRTQMHMFGLMWAPSDNITLMLMLNSINKQMEHISFAGPSGTTELGNFTTRVSGLGDTRAAALVNLFKNDSHRLHMNLGFSLPTGDIDNTDIVLTPLNTRPNLRLPYAMQLGTGTIDFEPGLTYTGNNDKLHWGSQLKHSMPIEENNDDRYRNGDLTTASFWGGYSFSHQFSTSLRYTYRNRGRIRGIDSSIVAPVQTADPDNYGGRVMDLGIGFNYVIQSGILSGHRFAFEYNTVVDQIINGVQMDMSDMFTLGYQVAF